MQCKSCGQETDELKSSCCKHCQQPLGGGVYAPPEGYHYHVNEDKYYQIREQDGAYYVTWFNQFDGTYDVQETPMFERESLAAATAQADTDEFATDVGEEPVSDPPPEPAEIPGAEDLSNGESLQEEPLHTMPTAAVAPSCVVPDGFFAEPGGVMYRFEKTDAQANVRIITRLNPATGQFMQSILPLTEGTKPVASPAQTKKPAKKSAKPIAVALVLLLLLGGLFAVWYFDLYRALPFADKLSFLPTRAAVFDTASSEERSTMESSTPPQSSADPDAASASGEESEASNSDTKGPKTGHSETVPPQNDQEQSYFYLKDMATWFMNNSYMDAVTPSYVESEGKPGLVTELTFKSDEPLYWSCFSGSWSGDATLNSIIESQNTAMASGEMELHDVVDGSLTFYHTDLTKAIWDSDFAASPKRQVVFLVYNQTMELVDYVVIEFTFALR